MHARAVCSLCSGKDPKCLACREVALSDIFWNMLMSDQSKVEARKTDDVCHRGAEGSRVCPVCLGQTLIEIRGKLQCERCHTICETCCEGGRG
jgi:hypothetical protein